MRQQSDAECLHSDGLASLVRTSLQGKRFIFQILITYRQKMALLSVFRCVSFIPRFISW